MLRFAQNVLIRAEEGKKQPVLSKESCGYLLSQDFGHILHRRREFPS
jgi:hypothetical protein